MLQRVNPLELLGFGGHTVHLVLRHILVLIPPVFDVVLDQILVGHLDGSRHILQCQVLSRIAIVLRIMTVVDHGTLLDIQCGQFL